MSTEKFAKIVIFFIFITVAGSCFSQNKLFKKISNYTGEYANDSSFIRGIRVSANTSILFSDKVNQLRVYLPAGDSLEIIKKRVGTVDFKSIAEPIRSFTRRHKIKCKFYENK